MNTAYDTIIVGGGLVGAALACGIAARGGSVTVLDGGDRDFRASRGNFGLVWVQGKGAEFAPYARWSWMAAKRWPEFERELRETTGIDVGLAQNGGYDFCLDQVEWQARAGEMRLMQQHTRGKFDYEMLENTELRQRIPQISGEVFGASYSDHDGHVNPLYLLRALHQRMQNLGCHYYPNQTVVSIRAENGCFTVNTASEGYQSEQILLCAGLDNQRLASDLGMHIPLHPIRGQLLITERVEPFLPCASLQVRQTMEGTLQIGDSHEDVGLDESTTLDVITRLAARAVRIFPHLREVHMVRAWGALRVMTRDGYPVYHRSSEHPGAYVISCHSGVTLASLHAGTVADWICGDGSDALIAEFSAERFDV
jgi:glycine/D-amino acid oxidase-like deaminating enzyme